jgi:DNA end-binding protein Ku
MRPIWTGAIGFGLVNIPVKLYSAAKESDIALEMLDQNDHAKIHFKRVNENSGKEVEWENIVYGYKYDHDHYVVLDEIDFEHAAAIKSKMIEIEDFVKEDEIDSRYYETPYYLEPEEQGVRAYGLFREALKKSGKVGVATFVLRNKEHIAILKPVGNLIVLNRVRFDQEIRDESELNIPEIQIKPKELQMALSLIDQLTAKFDIKKYKDTYAEKLMEVIEAKKKGTKIIPFKMKVSPKAGDLMSQLKASLSTKKRKTGS